MLEQYRVSIIIIVMAGIAGAQQYGAIPELGPGMSPRYFLGIPPVVKRQSGYCGANKHHCQDIDFPDVCCNDDQYCYVNPQGQASCCAIDSTCDSPCPVSQYLCSATSTTTGIATTTSACCLRPCSAFTAYKCAASYGGKCCSLGFSCVTSGCVSTSVAPTTLVSIIPSGCSTGQFSCASSIGGGCCNNGEICTQSDNTLLCASGTTAPSAIRTGPNGTLVSGISETTPDSGLSSGAKAGIGIGIGLFACLVIAGLLWFCMRRRKAAPQAQTSSQQSESLSGGPSRVMSQTPRTRRSPGASDYFGPAAVVGPYTDNESPGNARFTGVPVSPDNPNDIVPAVEIGNSKEHSNVTSPGEVTDASLGHIQSDPESTEYRAELP